jgi:hypothetical protein
MICVIDKTTFTGADFIAALGGQLTAIGSFNAAAIDLDVSLNGDFSQVGIAATALNKWVISCQFSMNVIDSICDTLKQGFKFMVLDMYYKLYAATQKSDSPECKTKCECNHEDGTPIMLTESACRFFCMVSACIKRKYLAWLASDCDPQTFDFSAFGVGVVTDNCVGNASYLPYSCDSCGC